MKPTLDLGLRGHLTMTPQLQQAIRLLQLSTLELNQEVGQMLEQNPFLEAEDDAPSAFEQSLDRAADGAAPPSATTREVDAAADGRDGSGGDDGASAPGALDAGEFGTTEREDWANGTEGDDFDGIRELPSSLAAAGSSDDDAEPRERAGAGTSLAEHLRAQIVGMRLSPEDAAALQVLIESLDDDGYLADTLDDIAAQLAPDAPSEVREDLLGRLQCALRWLQQLEPAGVGARTLGECLCLQLAQQPASPARAAAQQICSHHLAALARRDMRRLSVATGADDETLKQAHALIVACEPKPGRPFGRTEATPVVPDVIVQRAGRGWKVMLNPDVMPRLRINDLYAQAIKGQRSAGNPLGARLQEARWFVKNIQQRFDTILRVATAIVERQKNFFSHGEIAMKPLVLREIADELGLHESTISRVTTAKYMASPIGTFELKYFFGSSLNTEAGGNASSTAVRALIKQLVAAESAGKPLSDSQLAKLLEEQGIQVARRTVAKYREGMKIAPANLRRAM